MGCPRFPSTALDASACPSVRAMVTLKSMTSFPGGSVELSTRDVSSASTGTRDDGSERTFVGWQCSVRSHFSCEWQSGDVFSRREIVESLCVPRHMCPAHRTASTRLVLYSSCVLQTMTLRNWYFIVCFRSSRVGGHFVRLGLETRTSGRQTNIGSLRSNPELMGKLGVSCVATLMKGSHIVSGNQPLFP